MSQPSSASATTPPSSRAHDAVLLVNLGTPEAPTPDAVRRYLLEFLSDRRVVSLPPLLWQPILQGAILSTRPQQSGANYARIWDRENNDSPLRVITRSQAEKLQVRLGDQVVVDFGMRYGNPSTRSRLEALQAAGCQKILLAPLYPQYSATTTATANDKAFEALKTMRWQPAVRTLPPYFDEDIYVSTLAQSIADGVAALDFEPDVVITSYHGMPKSYLERGDPYHCQCHKTTRLVRERLGWPLRASLLLIGFATAPVFHNLKYGQVNVLVLAIGLGFLWLLRKDRPFAAALVLSVGFWLKLYPLALVLLGLRRGWAARGALGLLVGIVAVPLVLLPIVPAELYRQYTKTEMVFDDRLSLGSLNLHRSYFGETFGILREGGRGEEEQTWAERENGRCPRASSITLVGTSHASILFVGRRRFHGGAGRTTTRADRAEDETATRADDETRTGQR